MDMYQQAAASKLQAEERAFKQDILAKLDLLGKNMAALKAAMEKTTLSDSTVLTPPATKAKTPKSEEGMHSNVTKAVKPETSLGDVLTPPKE